MSIPVVAGTYTVPDFDPVAKKHFYIVMISFAVDLDTDISLTQDNIVSASLPGCYYCGTVYTDTEPTCKGWVL